jgi:UDP-N-acetylglucosamine 2-epimerase (non-hydrolysing)
MPEEINRVVTDAISDLHLVSEPSGEIHLGREGIDPSRVHYVGNVMIDTLVSELGHARRLDTPARHGLKRKAFATVTLHRPANVDVYATLAACVDFLLDLRRLMDVIFPMHPRTRRQLEVCDLLSPLTAAGVVCAEPFAYREMLGLLDASTLVVTDSGGIQEETTFLDVPCLTARSTTERPATVTHGTNTLIAADFREARDLVRAIQTGSYKHATPIRGWDGCASDRVVRVISTAWAAVASAPA